MDPGQLQVLTLEALRDAVRRKVVLVVLVVCFLCLAMMYSCTSCNGEIELSGDLAKSLDVLAYAGYGLFCVLSLWTITLAGLLAADHLSESLADGSALLVLARPVGRGTFALSRLLGSLGVSLGAGLILLGGATLLLSMRNDLAPLPAVAATLACFLSGICVASLAMAASLYLPRVAIFMLVFVFVAVISVLNLASVSGAELSGVYLLIDQVGPPLASSIAIALKPWSGQLPSGGDAAAIVARLFAWAGGGVVLLLYVFGRSEISKFDSR